MGYVTTRKLMALCRLGVRRAAESSGAADDTVDFGGMSRQRKQLFTLTLEFIAGWQDLRACLRDWSTGKGSVAAEVGVFDVIIVGVCVSGL
jgi:hypothetical protein